MDIVVNVWNFEENFVHERGVKSECKKLYLPPFKFSFSAICSINFCVLIGWRWNVPNSRIIVYFFNKFERRIAIFVRHLVKCHANHVTKARILIGWKIATHICQSFTRQIRVCQHEKVGENRDKFYLSPTVCQHVCQLFLCRSHTPTWVCQHEFANLSLSCEGPFRLDQLII